MQLALFRQFVTDALNGPVPETSAGGADSILPEIRTHLGGATDAWTLLNGWKRELIVRWICFQEDPMPHLGFVAVALNAVRGHMKEASGTTDWANITRVIATHRSKLQQLSLPLEHQLIGEDRNVAIGNAAKTLISEGYGVNISYDHISLPPAQEQALGDRILELSEKIGGVVLADAVYRNIQPLYSAATRRYHLIRKVSPGPVAVAAQVPWGYLYQLAIKFVDRPCRLAASNDPMQLPRLTQAAFALYGWQPYNFWEAFHLGPHSLLPYLQKAALYDATFSLPQLCGEHARMMAHGLFEHLSMEQRPGSPPLDTTLLIADQLLQISKPNEAVIVTAAQLSAALNMQRTLIEELLQRVFAHARGAANQKLGLPPQSTAIDAWLRPLVRMARQRYYLPPRSLAAPAVLEALLKLARDTIPHFEQRHLGNRTEQFVIAEFKRRGLTTHHGKYAFPEKLRRKPRDGECDLVVQTDTHLLFFEMKCKALTRSARDGSDIEILIGLSKSLIDSQLQIMRHEKLLRERGELRLIDSNGTLHTIPWNNRPVERISLGLHDYASLQDRVLLQRFLQTCARADFDHPDPNHRDDLKKLGAMLVELRELAQQLGELDPSNASAFFPSWFLSVPQLLLLLEGSHDNESFRKQLWRQRHVLTGSLDFYAEYAYQEKLRAS